MYIGRWQPEYHWAYTPELIDIVRKDFIALAPLYRHLRGICDDIQDQADV